jgi:hypothetical protein
MWPGGKCRGVIFGKTAKITKNLLDLWPGNRLDMTRKEEREHSPSQIRSFTGHFERVTLRAFVAGDLIESGLWSLVGPEAGGIGRLLSYTSLFFYVPKTFWASLK